MSENGEHRWSWIHTAFLRNLRNEPNRLEIWAELGKAILSIPDISDIPYETIAEYLEIPESERPAFYDALTSNEND